MSINADFGLGRKFWTRKVLVCVHSTHIKFCYILKDTNLFKCTSLQSFCFFPHLCWWSQKVSFQRVCAQDLLFPKRHVPLLIWEKTVQWKSRSLITCRDSSYLSPAMKDSSDLEFSRVAHAQNGTQRSQCVSVSTDDAFWIIASHKSW